MCQPSEACPAICEVLVVVLVHMRRMGWGLCLGLLALLWRGAIVKRREFFGHDQREKLWTRYSPAVLVNLINNSYPLQDSSFTNLKIPFYL